MRFVGLAMVLAAVASPACAQEVTMGGVARSASLMRQILESCGAPFDIDRELLVHARRAFVEAGESAYGRKAFDAALSAEDARRAQEARTTGSDRWCALQRERLPDGPGLKIFR